MTTVTENDVIDHVIKYGRYFPGTRNKMYAVNWKGRLYSAKDTRDLVIEICTAEGIDT